MAGCIVSVAKCFKLTLPCCKGISLLYLYLNTAPRFQLAAGIQSTLHTPSEEVSCSASLAEQNWATSSDLDSAKL